MKLSICKFILYSILIFIFVNFASAQAEREKGIELSAQGNYKDAINLLKQATKKDSNDAEAWYYLGSLYFKTGKVKEAEKAFGTVIKLRPNDSQGYIGMAYLQVSANKIYNAQTLARKALELNSQNPEAHYILGIISFRNDSYSGAYEYADKVIKINPNFANAYLLKSEALTFSFGKIRGTVTNSPTKRVDLLKESIINMEKYLSLSTDDEDKRTKLEKLESLKFFADYHAKPENQIPNNLDTVTAVTANSTPVKIKSKPRAEYTTSARQAGVSGTIQLLVGFSEGGKAKYVLVLNGLGFGLDEQAIKAVKGIEFEPATKDGKPISVVKIVVYTFTLY